MTGVTATTVVEKFIARHGAPIPRRDIHGHVFAYGIASQFRFDELDLRKWLWEEFAIVPSGAVLRNAWRTLTAVAREETPAERDARIGIGPLVAAETERVSTTEVVEESAASVVVKTVRRAVPKTRTRRRRG